MDTSKGSNNNSLRKEYNEQQRKSILIKLQKVNFKLKSKGHKIIKLNSIDHIKSCEDMYNNDMNVLDVFESLINEVNLLRDLKSADENLLKQTTRQRDYWKDMSKQTETLKSKSERKIREMEVENLKLQYIVSDLNERKKGIEQKIRDIRNGWETYKLQVNRDKRRADLDREELVSKLNVRKRLKIQNNSYHIKDQRPSSEMIMKLLSENEKAKKDFIMVYAFVKNVYECLERLKASDGNYPIDGSFLINDNQIDEIGYMNAILFLNKMDKKFINILQDMQYESFGNDDTFRSKRIGREKQDEINRLKSQLDELQNNYDKVVETMNEWRKWNSDNQKIVLDTT